MNTEEIKDGLDEFTKAELLEIFKSLEIKKSENKPFVIAAILNSEPTEDEILNFKKDLANKTESNEPDISGTIDMRESLGHFTKAEMVSFFPSLNLNENSGRPVLVEKIANGSPEGKEVNEFKRELSKRLEAGKPNSKDEFLVVSNIKENGKLLKEGDPYRGPKSEKFLAEGQIKKRV